MFRNEGLESGNGYFAHFLGNGNLVLSTSKNVTDTSKVFWELGVNKKPLENQGLLGTIYCRLTLQRDGNLVIYTGLGEFVWASGTDLKGVPPYILTLQKDRNLVLYDGTRKPLWASNTNI